MTFKSLFLPLGLVVAIVWALLFPQGGQMLQSKGWLPILIMVIFVINGYQTKISLEAFNLKLWLSLAFAIGVALFLSPVLGVVLSQWFPLSPAFALGLLVMSAMPATLSSGIVITEVARGNAFWAMLLTMVLNFVGILSIPFVLSLSLEQGQGVGISPYPLLWKLCSLVLMPFLLGMAVKKGFKDTFAHPVLSYIPSVCVILVVLAGLSSSRELVLAMPIPMFMLAVCASLSLHFLLMLILWAGAKLLSLGTPETKALVFVASQKTLPIAISVLAALPMEMGRALLLCLVFHFSQLIVDSFVASKWN